jgi:Domain of unknown function (DUF4303)
MEHGVDYIELRLALITATKKAFGHISSLLHNEKLYAFGLYTNAEGSYLYPTANTEEGLLRKSHNYSKVYSLSQSKKILRWSPSHWDYHLEGQEYFEEVNRILNAGWSKDYGEFIPESKIIFQICMNVLSLLDSESFFGLGITRECILINIFKGNQETEELVSRARILNSLDRCNQFEKELRPGL